MAETNGSGGSDRLGPVERILEAMAKRQAEMQNNIAEMQDVEAGIQQDIKILLRAQIVMGDGLTKMGNGLTKMGNGLTKLEEAHRQTEEAQRRTEANLNALILTVDEMIRGRKRDSE